MLPRRELTMLPTEALDAYYPGAPAAGDGPAPAGTMAPSGQAAGE